MMSISNGSKTAAQPWSDLKGRFIFVVLGLFVYRLGIHVPVPGVDLLKLQSLLHQQQNGILGLFNMFSGGALSRLSVFSLGVMPYISTSIIMQLFSMVVPVLEQWRKEGEIGRRKINQYTRYGTFFLAIFQAMAISKWLATQGIVMDLSWNFYIIAVLTLTTGTLFLMWLGEQMTERGIGNGISLIIFAGIVSRLPSALGAVMVQVRQGQMQFISLLLLLFVVFIITSFVTFVERGERKIKVNYGRQRQGWNRYSTMQSTHLPLKVNMSGVIPPIFASSVILLPATLAHWFAGLHGWSWLRQVSFALAPGQPLYMIFFTLAVLFFSFFYTAMVFNPHETADQLKRSGAFVPGIRPGVHTAKYVDEIVTRLTLVGGIYLCCVVLVPQFFILAWHVPFYFGGTSLLIVVVVVMDMMTQVQTRLMSSRYHSMLKKPARHTKRHGSHLSLLQ